MDQKTLYEALEQCNLPAALENLARVLHTENDASKGDLWDAVTEAEQIVNKLNEWIVELSK